MFGMISSIYKPIESSILIKKMKRSIGWVSIKYLTHVLLWGVFFIGLGTLQGQVIQSVAEPSKKSIPVYITDYPDEADLHVFIVPSKKQAQGNQGFWYFQDSQTYAEKKIFFVGSADAATLKIYFVEEKNEAGWIRKEKQKAFE